GDLPEVLRPPRGDRRLHGWSDAGRDQAADGTSNARRPERASSRGSGRPASSASAPASGSPSDPRGLSQPASIVFVPARSKTTATLPSLEPSTVPAPKRACSTRAPFADVDDVVARLGSRRDTAFTTRRN